MLDAIGKTRGANEVKGQSAMQTNTQQPIKAREMIHMGVRHEHVAHAQQLPGRQRRELAEIEQQGPAAEAEIDEEPGIRERIVDETRLN